MLYKNVTAERRKRASGGKGRSASRAKSSVQALYSYITDAGKSTLVEYHNLIDDQTAVAVMAALAAQSRVADPLHHCLLSWPEGEHPTGEQAVRCGRLLLRELGYAEHYGVMALHRDTDNDHLHIMAVRIHPDTKLAHTPYLDKLAGDRICRELELRYGFREETGPHRIDHTTPDPTIVRVPRRDPPVIAAPPIAAGAHAFEQSTGIDSFQSWVAAEPAVAVRSARTWADVHDALTKLGVAIERKGSGAILRAMANPNLTAKFSHAGLGGITKLERRLGPYVEPPSAPTPAPAHPPGQATTSAQHHARSIDDTAMSHAAGVAPQPLAPAHPSPSTKRPVHDPQLATLRATFDVMVATSRTARETRKQALAAVRAWATAKRRELADRIRSLREKLRASHADDLTARTLADARTYLAAQVSLARATEREATRTAISAKRATVLAAHPAVPPPRWEAYLRQRAATGDAVAAQALAQLDRRSRRRAPLPPQPALVGQQAGDRAVPTPATRALSGLQVHRDAYGGVAYHRHGEVVLRDNGRAIQVVGTTADAARAALLIGAERYRSLTVAGGDAFQAEVVRIAVAEGLAHRITNPELQVSIRAEMARIHPDPTDTTPPPAAQVLRAAHIERHPMHKHSEALRQIPAMPLTADQALARRRADDARRAKPPATPPTPTADRPAADTRPAAPPGVSAAILRARARGRDR